MASSTRRNRFRYGRIDGDTAVEISSDSSSDEGYESEIESMTSKGIKRLCSELLELKKVSYEGFRRNVYSNYSAFIRVFEEVGILKSDLRELKGHISTQRELIKDLTSNLYLKALSEYVVETIIDEMNESDLCSPSSCEAHIDDTFDTVDILLSEHKMEEAMVLLEMTTQTIEKMSNEDSSSPLVMAYMSAISVYKTKIANHFSHVAQHPRVSQTELHKALYGLCKLGETNRASFLLLGFYRSRLICYREEFLCSKPILHGNYLKELARIVFSVISQAARSFVVLYGESSSYTSELIKWATEETEAFCLTFEEYVKSISEISGSLSLAVEAVNCVLSYCSLLESQRIFLQADLVKLIRPCMKVVLQIHIDHLKKVIGLLVVGDTCIPGRFLIAGIFREKLSVTGHGAEMDYCLLTSSGRKFITLIQEVVDDMSPLVILQMESLILKALAEMFNVYTCSLESAISSIRDTLPNDSRRSNSDQMYKKQLSLLVNSTTLVGLFPILSARVFKGGEPSDNLLSDHTYISSQNKLDGLILSIEEAADRVWECFCQQVIYDITSRVQYEARINLESDIFGKCGPSSEHNMMPSFAFQMRQIKSVSESIFIGEDRITKKLLRDLMEAMILWLSDNQEYWKIAEDCSHVQKHCFLDQVYLDIHFLAEFAQLGGFFSDALKAVTMDLLERAKATALERDLDSGVRDEKWAMNSAKTAIKKLSEVEIDDSQPQEETAATIAERSSMRKQEDVSPPIGEDAQGGLDLIDQLDAFQVSAENMTDVLANDNIGFKSPKELQDDVGAVSNGDQFSTTSNSCYVHVEDEQDAARYNIREDRLCEREEGEEGKVEEAVIIPEMISAKKGEYITIEGQSIKNKAQDFPDIEDPELDARVSEVSDDLDPAKASSGDSEGSAAFFDASGSPSGTQDEATDLDFVVQSRDMDWFIEVDDSNSHTTSQELMQDDKLRVGNEITSFVSINKCFSEATDLAIGNSSRNQCEDFESVKSHSSKAADSIRLQGGPERHKNISAAKNSERKREASSTNPPRWH
ncbi:exocyst complex component EXO84A-like isoform X2 [Typha angustifolia]|uniref:exocyst complex component EXO84A-like isoform X2 n=1 Tax=Typha angustifolia TaxID=59011 RepID=UPI003C2F2B94